MTGITAVDDALLEGDETIIIDITSVSGGSAVENGTQQQTVTISDDEDGTAPTISAVSIPNSVHKVGDTVTATITVSTDSDDYTTGSGGISGTINGYALSSLNKINDTTYSAAFTITDGGSDTAAGSGVPVNLTLTDSAGNTSSAFTTAVSQSSDAIYANLPEISLTADTNSIVEFAGVSTITATISGSLNNQWPDDITVSLAYTGTGTAGTDYSKSDSITIAAGSRSNSAMIISAPDSLFDAAVDETVIVDISSLSVGSEGTTNQQIITINDAQSAPTVTLTTGNSSVAENAGTSTITATLSSATYADVTVNLGYTGTAASGGTDYNTPSSSIIIPAGSTSASAVTGITAVDDVVLEGDESIIIDITSVSGGSAAENAVQQKTITISDDERIAASLSVSSSSINEDAGQATVTVTLDKVAVETVTVDLGFSGTAGSFDYSTTAESISIDAGQTQGTISVTSLADQIVEADETIIVDISSVSGSSADENGVQQQTITIVSAPTPMITSAAYDASTGYLVVSGVNFEARAGAENDVDISLLTLTGKGDAADSYRLSSTTDVELDSTTQFTVLLSGADKTAVDSILDKTGTSASDSLFYNLAADNDFMNKSTAEDISDLTGNAIIVSKVAPVVNTPADAVVLNSDSQIISGTYSTDGISISLYLDADNDGLSDGGAALGSDIVSGGEWSIETSLVDDTVYNTVVIADFAGAQESAHIDVATISEDSTIPAAPVVISPAEAVNESGSSYIISGSHAEENVTVKLYADSDNDGIADNTVVLASDIVSGNAWLLTTAIDLGANNFVVAAQDAAVNSSSSIDVATITRNTIPSISQGSSTVLTTAEDSPGEITLNASDAENNTLTWSITSQGANGAAAASGTGDSKVISYMPDSNFNGSDSFVVSVTDNMESVSITVNVSVDSVNDSPLFTTAARTSAVEDTAYSYTVAAADNDDANITISALSKPGWLTLVDNGSGSAELSGMPVNAHVGEHNVVLKVSDAHSGSAVQSFTISVSNTNDAPVISGKPAVSVNENSSYSFMPAVFDDDLNDTKTFSISNKPGWAAFDSKTGALTGTPGNADVGTTTGIIISVKDSAQVSAALAAFNLQVVNVNDAPEGIVTIVGNAVEDSVLTAAETLTDADGLGTLIYQWKADGVNVGANSNTYRPDDDDVGKVITLTISYTDAHNTLESKTSGATAAVLNVNDAPAGSLTISGSAAEHSVLTAHNTLSDADGLGKFSYQWYADNNAVSGAAASAYTLTAAEIGKSITVIISYTDAHNTAESIESAPTASVVNVNDAPLISGTPETSVEAAKSYRFIPTVSDVDAGDTVTFTIVNKPAWAGFDPKTGTLTGTPAAENVGTTNAIVITAADSAGAKSSLPAFNIAVTDIDKTPSLLGIEDIEVNAQALLTQVALGEVTAEDYLGEAIDPVKPDSFLAPGEHIVTWTAADSSGNEVSAQQTVKVHPLISLGKNAYVKEGESYTFRVYLNGNAPQYPVSVPYMVYGDDQQPLGAVETVTISEQDKTYGEFIISSAMTSVHKVLTVQLDPLNSINNLNLDVKSSLILTRIEENMAPKVDLTVVQEGQERTQVTTTGNKVTITADSVDSNKDTLETLWSSENNALINSSTDEKLFIFDPQNLPAGVYKVTATVTETDTAERYSNTQDVHINVTAVLPDYVSAPSELPDNAIAHKASDGNKYLLEAEPGTKVTFGRLSLQESQGGAKVSIETIEQDPAIELDDAENVNVGGIFDFEIHDLPVNGQSVNMVLPLRAVVPEDAVYRKYISGTGWIDFVEDSNNALYSAKGADGYCPPPSSNAYTQGLTAGDWCVRLTIEDGGANDDDGKANGTIVDPSGVTVNTPVVVPVVPVTPVTPVTPAEPVQNNTNIVNTSGGGGSSSIMLMFIAVLSGLRRYGKKILVFSLALLSFSSQANNWFIDVDLGMSKAHEGDNLSSVPADNIINRDTKDFSWSLGLGYNLTDNWALAARYIDLGQGSAELKGSTADYHQSVINATPMLVKGVGLEVSYRLYSYQAFSSSVTLGGLSWRSEVESRFNGETIQHTQKGTDFYAGASIAYDLNESWQAAAAYKRYFIDVNDVDNVSLKLIYRF
ncbi:putative Ig domain-containing protein [Psychromonas aquimarina]|uniref:putative Ig domain-containing protein n=1 Tax=Psychromonas aquimarina TaxID=444919 RepID=UPI000429376D|nr:putative Ig domain-containing protein [Psychromonas aquimarina]